jgi:lipopolysaccharide export system ATP-binding protein
VTVTSPARPAPPAEERASAVLAARALTKSYGRRLVVQRVNVEIRTGEVVGLLGPNGAGKTTTFYMMVGLTRPDSGQVLLGDADITALPMYLRARAGIGYLPQEASIFRKLTAEENVRAILETVGLSAGEQRTQARRLLEELGILGMAKQPAYTLSGGERRRLEICRALATSPSFILLDEPFAGIDPLAVHEIQGIIGHLTERGIGILITDHNVRETLKITDRAYILREGEVFRSGTPSELASDEEVRRVYLGESFQLDERGPRAPGV